MKRHFLCSVGLCLHTLTCISFAQANEPATIKPYGFLKASGIYSNRSLNSFGKANLVAPTSASKKSSTNAKNDRSSFQVEQSRFGVNITKEDSLTGTFEFDLIDFNQSNPTTQTRPRLRRAILEGKINDTVKIQAGQDWDTFSPLRPNTYDIIGLYFNGGNVGFMRQEVKVKIEGGYQKGTLSIGQSLNNNTNTNNALENEHSYSLAGNWQSTLGTKSTTLVTSFIVGKSQDFDGNNIHPFGLTLGGSWENSGYQILLDTYYGKGLAFLNVLDIPTNKFSESFGGFFNFKMPVMENLTLVLGEGVSLLESSPHYGDISNSSPQNLGLKKNLITRGSLTYKKSNYSIFTEITQFNSYYQDKSKATSTEAGLITYF